MSRGASTTLSMVLLAAWVLATTGGCVEGNRAFFIRQNQVPQTGCVVSTNTTLYNPRGLLDVSMDWGYRMYPLLENYLKSTLSGDGEPERNTLQLVGFEVDLDMSDIPGNYDKAYTRFFQPVSGTIPPSSKLSSVVKVIADQLAKGLNIPAHRTPYNLIMATVTAVAKKNGSTFKSGGFVYPIDVCNGCLVNIPKGGTCPSKGDKSIISNTCGLPQDTPVTCCTTPEKKCFMSSTR